MIRLSSIGNLAVALALMAAPGEAQTDPLAWSDPKMSPDTRADLVLAQMTLDEKISLVHGHFPRRMKPLPADIAPSAGYFPGVLRLGIPPLRETDASLGVAENGPDKNNATALPSGMALASTWNSAIAYAGGAMIGKQTRQRGFNILLAGGVNLTRDAYNGRNFEYLGEDPLLAGRLGGASISGIQSQHVASTVKHFVLNTQETGRHVVDARMSEAGLRESDLLAFEFAIEDGKPVAVMCSYNNVNGDPACENAHLLTKVLRTDWGWKGWVMSDWGAVHSVAAATAGLDQESGQEEDRDVYFDAPLKAAVLAGRVPQARLDEMVRRIVRGMFAAGLMEPAPPLGPLDVQADNAVALREGEAGIVLLKNDRNILPLAGSAKHIAVIGGHADIGVLSGGGSSQVVPDGSVRLAPPAEIAQWVKGPYYHPSAPLDAIRHRARGDVSFSPGTDVAGAVEAARKADIAIVFAEQWTLEGHDTRLRLSDPQEALIAAVVTANPRTIVVLETGGPVIMPWRDRVPGLIEAWYPGGQGGEAIARILFGEVAPSGRLPVTFAASADQLPRAAPPGLDLNPPAQKRRPWEEKPFAIDYHEGSSLGYRWFAEKGYKAAYPFGYGLSYTKFRYAALSVADIKKLTFKLTVTNMGKRAGRETAQLYLRNGPRRSQQRLLGWAQVDLEPGESKAVAIAVDPRLLANWDADGNKWKIDSGDYRIFAGANAADPALQTTVTLAATVIEPSGSIRRRVR